MTTDFRIRYWTLDPDGKTPVETDRDTWAAWFEQTDKRIVYQTMVDEYQVSTVFLGMDHSFGGGGPPVLWETMIFGPDDTYEDFQQRYVSYDDAVAGHTQAVTHVRKRHDGESK